MDKIAELKEAFDTAAQAIEDMKDDHTPDATRTAFVALLDALVLLADHAGVPGLIEPD